MALVALRQLKRICCLQLSVYAIFESILIYENLRLWIFLISLILLLCRTVSYEFYYIELRKLDLLQLYEYTSFNTEAFSCQQLTVSDIDFSPWFLSYVLTFWDQFVSSVPLFKICVTKAVLGSKQTSPLFLLWVGPFSQCTDFEDCNYFSYQLQYMTLIISYSNAKGIAGKCSITGSYFHAMTMR